MPTPPLTEKILKETVRVWRKCGMSQVKAAEVLGIARRTLQDRLTKAGIKDAGRQREDARHVQKAKNRPSIVTVETELRDRIRTLETVIQGHQRETLDARYVKNVILKLVDKPPRVPSWLAQPKKGHSLPGVPSLLLSDLHWGEVVRPEEIGGVNAYNLEIAHQRMRKLVDTTMSLLTQYVVNPDYPGIILNLGGDMVSGDIHEELSQTNEMPIMPAVLDLWGVLIWAIEQFKGRFGRVFIPCVTGNHGRNTRKPRAKHRHWTSFDWLLYQMLAKRFEADPDVTFFIPDGPDALYSVYGHRYLLTHGDQFRGGDGQIGAIGPLTRGNKRKLARNTATQQEYDTMLCGHWHQYMPLHRLIVNGSLKGYDEYANSMNFEYEPPTQALWLTHPQHGITISMPVYLDDNAHKPPETNAEWVRWHKAA